EAPRMRVEPAVALSTTHVPHLDIPTRYSKLCPGTILCCCCLGCGPDVRAQTMCRISHSGGPPQRASIRTRYPRSCARISSPPGRHLRCRAGTFALEHQFTDTIPVPRQ